jgi:hypothetical protein
MVAPGKATIKERPVMKDHTFDATLVAASPHSDKTNSFVKNVMQHIKAEQSHEPSHTRGFVYWLQHLHRPALALLALAAITLVSGVVYAAVQFAPALIQLLGKETNQRGATEYSVAGFAECSNMHNPTDRYEVATDAPALSDDEVKKILQARCETQWLQQFPSKQWPTYGTNPEWKDGDTIYYARLDMLAKVTAVSESTAELVLGDNTATHTPPAGEKIKAFSAGAEIPLSDIKAGDTVYTINRVSEVYRKPDFTARTKQDSYANPYPHEQPQVIGLIGLFKLSLPLAYYQEMQGYLTEIPECMGNPGERCPHTPSIDVYPTGSEGAQNPHLQQRPDSDFREISGTITTLRDDTLTLKTRKGTLYTVTVGDAGFKVYNRDYASAHTDLDATLKIGSNVYVHYTQPKNADPTKITKDQVWRMVLQLEGYSPKKNLKQY